ncbi:unnamed protein product [Notodromas monacha]|uniref:E3 ubiquitin-protein ligase n=1 Tax=Notodromas monacha TaxID=399045 RepID=A0A7R9BDA8_9CRUS|nr:unnamed protein product [Notodromas monacha]CAG0912404.1 unnamed protein product [Notodromas monacha]
MFPVKGNEHGDGATSSAVQVLLKKGKREAAAYIHSECTRDRDTNPQLKELLDFLLDPSKPLEDWELTDWCRWLLAAGKNPDEFAKDVRKFDCATTCGLVWTANFVAYRCRTCSISPCMSLCSECFRKGNHVGHDFNMFKSQSGGACDCGDTTVMRESGFCQRHGPNAQGRQVPSAPKDLLCVAEAMMPRIILRLIQHLREQVEMDVYEKTAKQFDLMLEADSYLDMLHSLSEMGTAMRKVMTSVLTNPSIYTNQTELTSGDSKYQEYMRNSQRLYEAALDQMPLATFSDEDLQRNEYPWVQRYKEVMPKLKKFAGFDEKLKHRTFLEELVFWTVRYHFPQKLVCLLLNMLPDQNYKEAFTRAFVLHYSRISRLLRASPADETLRNRVVHVSVQLYSNEALTLKMADEMGLLHIMVMSLNSMMMGLLCPAVDQRRLASRFTIDVIDVVNRHNVLNCNEIVIKEHCYWPLVSDLNSILSHRPVGLRFVDESENLLYWWFLFLSMFQGMNVNYRELTEHVEYEPNTYFAAFTAELDASATPMWALAAHFVTPNSLDMTRNILKHCLDAIRQWMEDTGTSVTQMVLEDQVTFHLPLHRFFAVFMAQAVRYQHARPQELMPPEDLLDLMILHPLRIHVSFYEIFCGLWVRNGLQIKGQADSYIQCHYCNSLVDPDLYLMQLGAMVFDPDEYATRILRNFHLMDWLNVFQSRKVDKYPDKDQQMGMVESCLIFLATLVTTRTNIGLSEKDLQRLEIVTLLCMGEKTHSQLVDLMPEKGGGACQNRDFEEILDEVACYKAPNFESGSGQMQQGMYAPKAESWEELYDPLYVLLRAVQRKEFQTSLDRLTAQTKLSGKYKWSGSPWPPFRIPAPPKWGYENPVRILQSRSFQAVLFVLLFRALEDPRVTDHVMALSIYLLDLVVSFSPQVDGSSLEIPGETRSQPDIEVPDGDYKAWFEDDNLSRNLRTNISAIYRYVAVCVPSTEVFESPETPSTAEGLVIDVDDDSDTQEFYDGTVGEVVEVLSQDNDSDEGAAREESSTYSSGSFHAAEEMETSEYQPEPAQSVSAPSSAEGEGSDSWALVETPPVNFRQLQLRAARIVAHHSNRGTLETIPRLMLLAGNEIGLSADPSRKSVITYKKQSIPFSIGIIQHYVSAGRSMPYEGIKAISVRSPVNTRVSINPSYSIISILLKLHSKLSGKPDSYEPPTSLEIRPPVKHDKDSGPFISDPEGRIGDGPFFIKKVLDKICRLDVKNVEYIEMLRSKLWPKASREEQQERARQVDRDERRRKARERQQKLMAEFASKQRQFMEKTRETDESMDTEEACASSEPSTHRDVEAVMKNYDCGICGQSAPSTEERPMALVVLIQRTSVTGHRHRNTVNLELPVTESEEKIFSIADTVSKNSLGAQMRKRAEMMTREFEVTRLFAINEGYMNGVHIQTCGHYLHIDCQEAYLKSLTGQRGNLIEFTHGEFICPLCRQFANMVLPITPMRSGGFPLGSSLGAGASQTSVINALFKYYKEMIPEVSNASSAWRVAVSKFLERIQMRNPKKLVGSYSKGESPAPLPSILRTNFEAELIARNGSLAGNQDPFNRRCCFVPLLDAIRSTWEDSFAKEIVQNFTPYTIGNGDESPSTASNVPVLLQDPVTVLFAHLVVPPLSNDIGAFTAFVRLLYAVGYVQNLTAAICLMTEPCRARFAAYVLENADRDGGSMTNLASVGSLVIKTIGTSYLLPIDQTRQEEETRHDLSSVDAVDRAIRAGLVHLLRLASLLRFYIFEDPLLSASQGHLSGNSNEFDKLCNYLRINMLDGTRSVLSGDCARRLHWHVQNPEGVVGRWVGELVQKTDVICPLTIRRILIQQQLIWEQPRLLQLPHEYDAIFRVYHSMSCFNCKSVPKDPAICLVCGTLVCMKDQCCKTKAFEAVTHSLDCGAGTSMFLAVNTSLIIVIRGRRACFWGSCYLDAFGEEDRDLKRGKPLYLCKERYKLLEKQWKTHMFDRTAKRWLPHKDQL